MEIVGRTLLGKYKVEKLLGQGGMGSVWLGTHVGTGRRVAIKILDERFLSNVAVVQRFGREARAASAIEHEGIVEVLDLDQTEDGLPFLVMEYLEGESLAHRIARKGKLAEDELVRIALLLLSALHAAHERGVVHRDLKPDNIFLVPAGRRGEIVKILDFGISSKDDEQTNKLTQTGSVLGTPHYMSPEQAMGDTTVDRRVDIYAAGVLLYECAVGDVPFDAPNYNKLLRVILDAEPVPPIERGALIGRELEAAILSGMAKQRDARPPTAEAFAETIARAARSHAPAASRPPGRRASMGPPRASAAPGARTPAPAPAPSEAEAPGTGSSPGRDAAASWASASLELGPSAPPARRSAPARPAQPAGPIAGFDDFGPSAGAASSLPFDEEALAGARRSGLVKRPALEHEAGAAPVTGAAGREAADAAPPRDAAAPLRTPPTGPHRPISSPLPAAPGPETPRASAPARAWWLPYALRGAVAVTVFVALVAGLRWLVQPGAEALAPPTPSPRIEPDAGATSSPDWVLVDLTGLPPGAEVRLDGLPGVSLPMRLRRGTHHRVVVRAPGYQDRTIELDADRSTSVHADLEPL